jgi:hypothetical protein
MFAPYLLFDKCLKFEIDGNKIIILEIEIPSQACKFDQTLKELFSFFSFYCEQKL